MHKHIERIRGALNMRRAHKGAWLGLAAALYALWLYLPGRFEPNSFDVGALMLVIVCIALATRVLIQPDRQIIRLLGAALILLLAPGPLITLSVQLVRSNPDITSWLWSFSILVAGASVASYLSFKGAKEHA